MIARYETNDLHLAATLQCLGLELLEVNRSDPRRVKFVFEDDALRREWTREYLAGGLRVDPLILLNSFRSLKRQIYADGSPANRVVRVVRPPPEDEAGHAETFLQVLVLKPFLELRLAAGRYVVENGENAGTRDGHVGAPAGVCQNVVQSPERSNAAAAR